MRDCLWLVFIYLCIHHTFCRPTPQIEWSKLGSELPKERETKENHGKTLKIENISYHDKGNYRCTANNLLGKASHDFHIIVQGMFPIKI